MDNFDNFDLPESLKDSLNKLNFKQPTPIQTASIPLILEGRDILGSAQTGTGKTGAFGIPLVAKLLNDSKSVALVLTPTRELATQVMKALEDLLGKKTSIKTSLLIGGDSMSKQLFQLRAKPRLIVGTPGRINDHLDRGTVNLSQANFLVLDETDRMLDMGFSDQIATIIKCMPQKRQTLLFSATLPNNIIKIANSYLTNPERVAVGSTIKPAQNLKQETMHIADDAKYPELVKQLTGRSGSVVVFVKTKYNTEKLAKKLQDDGFKANAIHGDLRHTKRESVIRAFRSSKYKILVATDIAARGLDIPHIEHVINYDLPQCPEDYIHRIGRTARAGAEGESLCFISPADKKKWHAINCLLNPELAKQSRALNENSKKRSGGSAARKVFGDSANKKRSFGKSSFGKKDFANKTRDFANKKSDGKTFKKKVAVR